MSQNISENSEYIKETICKFYVNNKTDCDSSFFYAENKEICEIYEKITDEDTIKNLFSQVSLVILTANKYEKNILHNNIFSLFCEKIKIIEINLCARNDYKEETYGYWFKWGNYTVLHIEAQKTGSYTIGGSADIVRYVLRNKYLYPMGVISMGICFGVDEKEFSLGDVIISKKIYPYFMEAKINENGYFVDDDNIFKVNSGLSARIKNILDKNVFSKMKCNVYFGNYITGEAVISSRRARNRFVKTTKQKIIGGEMEGYGLFKECNGSNYIVPCLTVKSICDWAIMKNFDSKEIFDKLYNQNNIVNTEEQKTIKDRIQAYTSNLAFHVVDILLKNHIFESSLYHKIIGDIEKMHGKALYAKQIKRIGQIKADECINGLYISNEFIIEIIKSLIECGLLSCDDDELKKILCNHNDQVWEYSFLINRR